MGSKSTALWTVFRVSRTSSQCKQIRCLWHIKDWIVWIVGLVPTFWSIVPAFIRIISYLVILVGSELAVLAASHWLATASAAQVVLHPFTFDCADVPTGVTSVTMARCMRSLAELSGAVGQPYLFPSWWRKNTKKGYTLRKHVQKDQVCRQLSSDICSSFCGFSLWETMMTMMDTSHKRALPASFGPNSSQWPKGRWALIRVVLVLAVK